MNIYKLSTPYTISTICANTKRQALDLAYDARVYDYHYSYTLREMKPTEKLTIVPDGNPIDITSNNPFYNDCILVGTVAEWLDNLKQPKLLHTSI